MPGAFVTALTAPLLDVRLFKLRPLGAGSAVITTQLIVTFGYIFLIIQYLQFLRGYSALSAGLSLFPMAVTLMAVAPIGPFLANRVGLRVTSVTGMVLLGASMLLTAWAARDGSYLHLAAGMVVLGLGIAYFSPYPVGFWVTSLSFGLYVLVRLFLLSPSGRQKVGVA